MKRTIKLSGFSLVVALASLIAFAGTSFAAIAWNTNASGILSMSENILNNGNGTYTYNYSFTNIAEQSPIWWVVLYTNAGPTTSTPFGDASHTGWTNMEGATFEQIAAPEGQAYFVYSWTGSDAWPNSTPNGIGLGQTVGGFSFTSATLDATSKRFVADRQGEWSGNYSLPYNGNCQTFSYGGETNPVPEPATMLLLGSGLLGLIGLKKKD